MPVNGLNGEHSLCNVEASLLHRQDVFAHQQCLKEAQQSGTAVNLSSPGIHYNICISELRKEGAAILP